MSSSSDLVGRPDEAVPPLDLPTLRCTILAGLVPRQAEAASLSGPVLVLAGAGTGKTRPLTAGVAWRMTELVEPPTSDHLTDHDRAHFRSYLRILDGVADGVSPAEIARVVLGVDMERDPKLGHRLFKAYHARAVWIT